MPTPRAGARSIPELASNTATIDTATITTATITTANITTSTLSAITGRTLALTATAAADEIVKVNQHASQTAAPLQWFVAGDANPRFRWNANGRWEWGAGGASAIDGACNLFRSAANTLRTDGTLEIAAGLTIIDGANIAVGSTTGTKIGLSSTVSKLGFFNATPIVRPSAWTQTYSTADKTIANIAQTALTHAVGTADGTVDDVGGAFNQTTLNNNFKEVTTQLANALTDVTDLKQAVNGIIDDLQALGLVG